MVRRSEMPKKSEEDEEKREPTSSSYFSLAAGATLDSLSLIPPFLNDSTLAIKHNFKTLRTDHNRKAIILKIGWVQDGNDLPDFDRQFNLPISQIRTPERKSRRRSTRSSSKSRRRSRSRGRSTDGEKIYAQAVAQVLRGGEIGHEYFHSTHKQRDSLADVVNAFLGDLDARGCKPDVFVLSEPDNIEPHEPINWNYMQGVELSSFVTAGRDLHIALDFTFKLRGM